MISKTLFYLGLLGLIAILMFFLLTEHLAHIYGALPWLFLLSCPLMHLFMHHGSHEHHHRANIGSTTKNQKANRP